MITMEPHHSVIKNLYKCKKIVFWNYNELMFKKLKKQSFYSWDFIVILRIIELKI